MADIKKIKPSLPKGTRDFLPEEVAKRNYIFDTIKGVFRKYGFQQIDTPAFERLETLTGKYGEEGDRLLFKILNSGDPFKDITDEDVPYIYKDSKKISGKLTDRYIKLYKESYSAQIAANFSHITDQKELSNLLTQEILSLYKNEIDRDIQKELKKIAVKLTEKGLRYDLTVPLARYVVQHNGELTFPFKRYHIGPVWRADRPQKGRYQEFYQCDADVIGSTSLLNEVELTQIYLQVFQKLRFDSIVTINHRSLLEEISKWIGLKDNHSEFATAIDKIHKIGIEGVVAELQTKNIAFDSDKLRSFVDHTAMSFNSSQLKNNEQLLWWLVDKLDLDENSTAVLSLSKILRLAKSSPNAHLCFDPLLARGLDYYTGIIWEANASENNKWLDGYFAPSLGGGGRYDNLTEMFGGRDMSGVGISFGIERIYDVMEELKLFPADLGETTKVLFVHFDEESEVYAFEQLQKVRALDIASEVYPGKKKLDKQMNYANDKKIPFVVVIGSDEMASGKLTFKNMTSGQQEKLTIEEIIEKLK